MSGRYVVELFEDPDTGDLAFELPPEVVEELEVEVGDELMLIDNGNGTVTLRKK